jgi:hypothetical protein
MVPARGEGEDGEEEKKGDITPMRLENNVRR